MLCIKDIILYSLIFPMPAASPFFLVVFSVALVLALRPCGYCLVLFSILFLSTSPNSPFINTYSPSPSPLSMSAVHGPAGLPDGGRLATPGALSSLPLSSPVPYRAWFDLNAGRLWDPRLVGYREMGEALGYERERKSEERSVERAAEGARVEAVDKAEGERVEGQDGVAGDVNGGAEEELRESAGVAGRLSALWTSINGRSEPEGPEGTREIAPATDPAPADRVPTPPPTSTPASSRLASTKRSSKPLPPGYLDLRYRGIGFVLDLGWRRTDEGIQWEIEEALGREWDRSELPVEREKRAKAWIAREEGRRARREMRRAEKEKEKEEKERGRGYPIAEDTREGKRAAEADKLEVKVEKKGVWKRAMGKVPFVGSW